MKVNLVATATLLAALLSVCEVHCFPHRGTLDTATGPGLHENWTSVDTEESIQGIDQRYMNLSVDPCDDFYEYACGNWKHVHPIKKDVAISSVLHMMSNSIQNFLRESLSGPVPPPCITEKLDAEEKARVYFAACVDEAAIKGRGSEPLLEFIDELGGWPVLDEDWYEEGFDWLQLAIKTSLLGQPSILATSVHADMQDPTRHSLYLHEPDSIMIWNNFWTSKYKEDPDKYKDTIVQFLLSLGVNACRARNAANEIVDFEMQLANITSKGQLHFKDYLSTNIAGLYERYPYIDWQTYLSGVQEASLQLNQTVVLKSERYYDNLESILDEAAPRTLANFMVWRTILPFASALDTKLFESLQGFEKFLAGLDEPKGRWKYCVGEVDENMELVTGAMYVRRHFDEYSKNETTSLLSDIREAFREILLDLAWIDEKTKDILLSKLNRINHFIGYPDFILRPEELDEFYSDLLVIPEKYFENRVHLAKFSSRVKRNRLQEKVNQEVEIPPPTMVNAMYSPNFNKILVPAGILQSPLYVKYAKAQNLAGIGVVLGHELTHAFDDSSREYDAIRNGNQSWGSEALKGFKERVNCFIEQYGNYSIDGQFINGTHTRNENIADNGGLHQAFKVYRKWPNLYGTPSEEMSSLRLTNDQLFFIGFAQVWCGVIRPSALENILKDVHAPNKFRVIGSLSNFEEFSDAFQCPIGSFMNPEKKCRLW